MPESEYRLYGYILDRLKELGWNTSNPARGGQVFMQNEVSSDPGLWSALGGGRPENVVVVDPGEYWVIEAKSALSDLSSAVDEAKSRAAQINPHADLSCRIITGIAGSPETTHYTETYCLVDGNWQRLTINNRESTGFISPNQVASVLTDGSANLNEYEIDDDLFVSKTEQINNILHQGGINNRNRAGVLASLLLALANDPDMSVSDNPSTLINDINTRAEQMMSQYGRGSFFGEISINLPTSQDNHVKHRSALVKTIELLRGLNITSAIDSGRDVLGQFYEQFLKYANDAKELGIVFTPRHITEFAAQIADVRLNDVVFDPACGTGGFLVAALDKVRSDGGNVDHFKSGNLHGIEQDPMIAALAIVNMIFRGDGSSNIAEGDCFRAQVSITPDKVLMNPPFALETEFEWMFVDRALGPMAEGGVLFAVVPTTTMSSADDARGEETWRAQMLQRHTLLSVLTLPEGLFRPLVKKGTYGILIKAHRPHNVETDNVVWAVVDDGVVRSKLTRMSQHSEGNLDAVSTVVRNFVASGTIPDYSPMKLDCQPIKDDPEGRWDLSPENYIGKSQNLGRFDVESVVLSMDDAKRLIHPTRQPNDQDVGDCERFRVLDFVENFERGKSRKPANLPDGHLPLVSTQEYDNGISAFVDHQSVMKIYQPGLLTISANGQSCQAFYHVYEFAANPDVWVISLKDAYADPISRCSFVQP